MTPKAIGNRIKAKGLQKLKFYCQMCEKQCRDENGFKCHTMSETHQRQLLLFADNCDTYLDQFSKDFKDEYLALLKRRFNGRRVQANNVYQEYINDRDHVHMNSTQWETLTEFVKWLGREGECKVDDTEKGWFVTYIDRDPEAIKRAEKKTKMVANDEEKSERILAMQMQRAKETSSDADATHSTELKREDDSEEKITFAMPKSISNSTKKVQSKAPVNVLAIVESDQKDSPSDSKRKHKKTPEKKRSAISELMEENEKSKKKKRKDSWLAEGIVVKIVTKDLGDKFYKVKGVIEEVFDNYGAKVRLLKGDKVIKLDQSHLETVIPQVGRPVLVLNGYYAGNKAVLEKIDTEKFSTVIKLSSGICKGRVLEDVPYEDVSKLHLS